MTAIPDHYRLSFCLGPTTISELFYDNYEESIQDFLIFTKMYWADGNEQIKDTTIESLAELTEYGEKEACVIGTAGTNIWWRRVEAGEEAVSLN